MPTFITRLALATGQILTFGEKWFTSDEHPVGLIIDRPEIQEQIPGEKDEPDSIEVTPAQYEIWLMPTSLSKAMFDFYGHSNALLTGRLATQPPTAVLRAEVAKVQNVVCRKVLFAFSSVLFTEEVVNIEEARELIHEFFASKIGLPEGEAAPQIATNGPAIASAG